MSKLSITILNNLKYLREHLYAKRSKLHTENAPVDKIRDIDEKIENITNEIIKLQLQIESADSHG